MESRSHWHGEKTGVRRNQQHLVSERACDSGDGCLWIGNHTDILSATHDQIMGIERGDCCEFPLSRSCRRSRRLGGGVRSRCIGVKGCRWSRRGR